MDNNLTTLPESIDNLKSLKGLGLEGNPLNQEFKKIIKMANGDIVFILRKLREIFEKERLELEREKLKIEKIDRVKKAVLDLGIKFARLQIAEISEVCDIDDVQLIVDTVKDMIDNNEIYAQYFSSTKSVAFDQQANLDEIDNLMSVYKDWEDKKVGKR